MERMAGTNGGAGQLANRHAGSHLVYRSRMRQCGGQARAVELGIVRAAKRAVNEADARLARESACILAHVRSGMKTRPAPSASILYSFSALSPPSPSPRLSSSLSFSPFPLFPVQIFLPPPHLPLTPPLRLLLLPSPFPHSRSFHPCLSAPSFFSSLSHPSSCSFLSPSPSFFPRPFSSFFLASFLPRSSFPPLSQKSRKAKGCAGKRDIVPGTAGASWIRKHRGGTQRRRARIPPRHPRHPPPRPRPRPQRLRPAHRLRPTHHRPSRTAA